MKKICLNMIVKDESAVIWQCLQSLKKLVHYWVIVDTGSSDGTQDMIRQCMQDIPGELHEKPWINFAHNRNIALNLAKNKGDYLLFLDADEKLIYSERVRWPNLQQDCYLAMGKYENKGNIEFGRVLLINNHLSWEWNGVVHEEIRGSNEQKRKGEILQHISILTDLGGARSKDPNKSLKDAKLLEDALKDDPKNSRNVFYLALSYDVSNQCEKANGYYQMRSTMNDNPDEVFYSLYRMARLQESMNVSSEIVIESYLKAFHFRPTRAEPLYYLAKYLFSRQPQRGFEIIKSARLIPQPKDPTFVEPSIYQYEMQQLFDAYALLLK